MASEEANTSVKQFLDEVKDIKENIDKEREPLFDLIVRFYQIASEIKERSFNYLEIEKYTSPFPKIGYRFNSFFLSYSISAVSEYDYLIIFEIYQLVENKEKVRTPNLFKNKYETITYYTWKRICYVDALVEAEKEPDFASALSAKNSAMKINSKDIVNIQYFIDILFKEANSYIERLKTEEKSAKKNLEELYQHVSDKLKDS